MPRTASTRSLRQIARPDVDYVSIKISALVANLDPLAFEHSVERITERLREVYRAAEAATPRVFVNLDMEEYRDLELSLVSFMHVLDEAEFAALDAGIVLQAYLPDSHGALERLGAWAAHRRAAGGGRTKVRLVKGANLAMELVEAEQHNWVAAPYPTKADVDASFKAMLDRALAPRLGRRPADRDRQPQPVRRRLGPRPRRRGSERWIASSSRCSKAWLPARPAPCSRSPGEILMYAPVVERDDFDASIAYLTRRLDENTQPENFLRSLFTLRPGSAEWRDQEARFRRAVARAATWRRLAGEARGREPAGFGNEPDTDLTD